MASNVHQLRPMRSISPAHWHGRKAPARDWLIDGVALRKTVCLFNGAGSAGKSLLMLQLMASSALGRPWLGRDIPLVKSFGLFAEDPEDEVWRRMEDVARNLDVDVADLDQMEIITSDMVGDCCLYRGNPRGGPGQMTPLWDQIRTFCIAEGRQLIVLDNVAMLFGGNQIASDQVTHFMSYLKQLAIDVNGVVVLLQHPSADGLSTKSGESGSRAWSNVARSRIYISFPPETDESQPTDERMVRFMKANYGPRHVGFRIEWRDGVFVPMTLADNQGGRLNTVDLIELNTKVIGALRELFDAGIRVSNDDPRAPNHVASVLSKRPDWRVYSWKEIAGAAAYLVRSNRAVVVALGPPSKVRKCLRPSDVRFPGETGGDG